MRDTLRVTWLLLSLHFLFHCVWSNGTNSTDSLTTNTLVVSNPTQVSEPGNSTPSVTVVPDAPATMPTQPGSAPTTTAAAASSAVATTAPTTTVASGGQSTETTPATVPSAAETDGTLMTVVTTSMAGSSDAPTGTKNPGVTTKTPDGAKGTGTPAPASSAATTMNAITSTPVPSSAVITTVAAGGARNNVTTTAVTTFAASESDRSPVRTPRTTTESATAGPSVGPVVDLITPAHPSTPATTTPPPLTSTRTTNTITTAMSAPLMTFIYPLQEGVKTDEDKDLVQLCQRLISNRQNLTCTLTYTKHNGSLRFHSAVLKVQTNVVGQYYEEIKTKTDNKTLITILASCGALLIMIIILGVCVSHYRKPYNENQQHLTEELHTVENGYHDNPTLEVMEVQPEMQEKKVALNSEFNDSWIVPMDNLLKEDLPDEEDTHL